MTTELEKEFFKVFGIEPHWQYKVHQFCHFYCCDKKTIIENAYLFKERKTCKVKEVKRAYPEITDRVLLEIICIHSYFCGLGLNLSNLYVKNPAELEAVIMQQIINWYQDKKYGHEKCKQQIQQLFKGEQ